MDKQKIGALQGAKKLSTLSDYAAKRLIEELLKMSVRDMVSRLNQIPPVCRELLKKVLDEYFPFEPKVQLKQILAGHTWHRSSSLQPRW